MTVLKTLKEWDTELFLFLNGHHNAFFDVIMYWASNKWFWIPLYFLLALLVVYTYKKRCWIIFVFVGILITLSDQISSSVFKPSIARLRPSHNPDLMGLVHLSKAGPGGMFGFVSGHATNCFALFIFLSMILAPNFKWGRYILFAWAILVSYSRIYVGVHYPGDVVCGALLGSIIGLVLAKFYEVIAYNKIEVFTKKSISKNRASL